MRKENKKEDKSFFNLNIFFINKNIKIMKKNFLLLMLMALLPLAGWAQISISGVTPTIGADSYYYTNSTPTITMTVPSPSSSGNLTATTDYTVRFYNADEEEITASNVKAVGTYYIAAAGTGGYEGVSQKVQFDIIKMPLVLKVLLVVRLMERLQMALCILSTELRVS